VVAAVPGVDLAITPFPWWKVERYQATPLATSSRGSRACPWAPFYYVGVFGPWECRWRGRARSRARRDVKTQGGYEFLPTSLTAARTGASVLGGVRTWLTRSYVRPEPARRRARPGHDEPRRLGASRTRRASRAYSRPIFPMRTTT